MMPTFLSKITDVVVTLLVGSVAGFVLVSMILALSYHAGGVLDWDKLGQIGEFWGGHLNSVALIFLGMTLMLQRLQFSEQLRAGVEEQKHLSQQVRLLQTERAQREFHFATEQLREESIRIPFKRFIMTSPNPRDWTATNPETGLFALEEAWHHESSSSTVYILLSQGELQSYLLVAEKAESFLTNLADHSMEMGKTFLEKLSPSWLAQLARDHRELEEETKRFFAEHCPAVDSWPQLIQRGWRLTHHQEISGRWVVVLIRDNFHDPRAVSAQGEAGEPLESVLDLALKHIENGS